MFISPTTSWTDQHLMDSSFTSDEDNTAWRCVGDYYDNLMVTLDKSDHKSVSLQLSGLLRSLKVLEFFSRFSRPGKSLKTDMVLESP